MSCTPRPAPDNSFVDQGLARSTLSFGVKAQELAIIALAEPGANPYASLNEKKREEGRRLSGVSAPSPAMTATELTYSMGVLLSRCLCCRGVRGGGRCVGVIPNHDADEDERGRS